MEEGTCFVYLSGKSRIESLDVAENNNNMYVDACMLSPSMCAHHAHAVTSATGHSLPPWVFGTLSVARTGTECAVWGQDKI